MRFCLTSIAEASDWPGPLQLRRGLPPERNQRPHPFIPKEKPAPDHHSEKDRHNVRRIAYANIGGCRTRQDSQSSKSRQVQPSAESHTPHKRGIRAPLERKVQSCRITEAHHALHDWRRFGEFHRRAKDHKQNGYRTDNAPGPNHLPSSSLQPSPTRFPLRLARHIPCRGTIHRAPTRQNCRIPCRAFPLVALAALRKDKQRHPDAKTLRRRLGSLLAIEHPRNPELIHQHAETEPTRNVF